MEKFEFSYDENEDDLFIYLKDKKSAGAVEFGNFDFDFDSSENLVAVQISEASKILSKLISKIIKINKIKEMQVEVTNFRNMDVVDIKVKFDSGEADAKIPLPRIKGKSPSLSY